MAMPNLDSHDAIMHAFTHSARDIMCKIKASQLSSTHLILPAQSLKAAHCREAWLHGGRPRPRGRQQVVCSAGQLSLATG